MSIQLLQGFMIGQVIAKSSGLEGDKASQVALVAGMLARSPLSLVVAKAMADNLASRNDGSHTKPSDGAVHIVPSGPALEKPALDKPAEKQVK